MTDNVITQVWVTGGGSRLHTSLECPSLVEGQVTAHMSGLQVHEPELVPVNRAKRRPGFDGEPRAMCATCWSPKMRTPDVDDPALVAAYQESVRQDEQNPDRKRIKTAGINNKDAAAAKAARSIAEEHNLTSAQETHAATLVRRNWLGERAPNTPKMSRAEIVDAVRKR